MAGEIFKSSVFHFGEKGGQGRKNLGPWQAEVGGASSEGGLVAQPAQGKGKETVPARNLR